MTCTCGCAYRDDSVLAEQRARRSQPEPTRTVTAEQVEEAARAGWPSLFENRFSLDAQDDVRRKVRDIVATLGFTVLPPAGFIGPSVDDLYDIIQGALIDAGITMGQVDYGPRMQVARAIHAHLTGETT